MREWLNLAARDLLPCFALARRHRAATLLSAASHRFSGCWITPAVSSSSPCDATRAVRSNYPNDAHGNLFVSKQWLSVGMLLNQLRSGWSLFQRRGALFYVAIIRGCYTRGCNFFGLHSDRWLDNFNDSWFSWGPPQFSETSSRFFSPFLQAMGREEFVTPPNYRAGTRERRGNRW